jgi:hypothetical protein
MAFLMTDLDKSGSLKISKLSEVLELMGYTYDPKQLGEYTCLASFDVAKLIELVEKEFSSLNDESALTDAFK